MLLDTEKHTVTLVTDDDTGETKVFASRNDAINFMYDESEKYGYLLFMFEDSTPIKNYIELKLKFPDSWERMMFLYEADDTTLNEIFESYYYIESNKEIN